MSAAGAPPPFGAGADLERLIAACADAGAIAGTVHRRRGDALHLTAAHRIPPAVVERTRRIPRGKGMAGLAWSRSAPVTTCDLTHDPTDDVRPGARAVRAGRAAALPVFADGALVAVVGFAFAESGDFDGPALDGLAERAARVAGARRYSSKTA